VRKDEETADTLAAAAKALTAATAIESKPLTPMTDKPSGATDQRRRSQSKLKLKIQSSTPIIKDVPSLSQKALHSEFQI